MMPRASAGRNRAGRQEPKRPLQGGDYARRPDGGETTHVRRRTRRGRRQPAEPLDARSATRRGHGHRRGERVHFRRSGTLDGAKAGDGGHGGSVSRLDEKMLFTAADQQRFGWLAG